MIFIILLIIIMILTVKKGKNDYIKKKKYFDGVIYWIPHGSLIYTDDKIFTHEILLFNKKYGKGFELLNKPEKYCIVVSNNIYNMCSWQYVPEKDTIIFPIPPKFNYTKFISRTTPYYETTRSLDNFKRVKNPFNPPMIIDSYSSFSSFSQPLLHSNKEEKGSNNGSGEKYYVFRDDLLYGGTKQRALLNYAYFMGVQNYDCVIYAGPPQGVAQVALGIICKHIGKPGIMIYVDPAYPFIRSEEKQRENYKKFPMSCKAEKMGIKLIYGGRILDDAQDFAHDFAKTNNGLLIPFGLDDPNFKGLLVESLCEAIPREIREDKIVLWTIVGSGLLMNAFYEVFPNALIIGVRAGKPIYFDSIDTSRTFTINAPYRFTDSSKILPPYATVPCYDGKIWEQFIKLFPLFTTYPPFSSFSQGGEKGSDINLPESKIIFLGENFKRKHYIWNVANENI